MANPPAFFPSCKQVSFVAMSNQKCQLHDLMGRFHDIQFA